MHEYSVHRQIQTTFFVLDEVDDFYNAAERDSNLLHRPPRPTPTASSSQFPKQKYLSTVARESSEWLKMPFIRACGCGTRACPAGGLRRSAVFDL